MFTHAVYHDGMRRFNRHVAFNTIGINDGPQLIGYFAKIMVGSAMAIGAILRIGGHAFNFGAMYLVAGGTFNFAVHKALAAGKQFYLVAMHINLCNILVGMKRRAVGVFGKRIAGLKIKRRPRHDI